MMQLNWHAIEAVYQAEDHQQYVIPYLQFKREQYRLEAENPGLSDAQRVRATDKAAVIAEIMFEPGTMVSLLRDQEEEKAEDARG